MLGLQEKKNQSNKETSKQINQYESPFIDFTLQLLNQGESQTDDLVHWVVYRIHSGFPV